MNKDKTFKGRKSQKLYDVFLERTRDAIEPKHFIQISKPNLRKLAGIGHRDTLNSSLDELSDAGLIQMYVVSGELFGNVYEVFTMEEAKIRRDSSHTLGRLRPNYSSAFQRDDPFSEVLVPRRTPGFPNFCVYEDDIMTLYCHVDQIEQREPTMEEVISYTHLNEKMIRNAIRGLVARHWLVDPDVPASNFEPPVPFGRLAIRVNRKAPRVIEWKNE